MCLRFEGENERKKQKKKNGNSNDNIKKKERGLALRRKIRITNEVANTGFISYMIYTFFFLRLLLGVFSFFFGEFSQTKEKERTKEPEREQSISLGSPLSIFI